MKFCLNLFVCLAITLCTITAKSQVVTLDYYFNHEVHINKSGQQQRYHYLWEDKENSGFSILGNKFINNGAQIKSLEIAPTLTSLKGTDIYIIVDPDNKKESLDPHFISVKDRDEITKWVKAGGVLVMLANDSANVELTHLNELAAKFGMHFNNDLQNYVIDDRHFDDGSISTTNNSLFKTAQTIFMKDVCSISLSGSAKPGLKNKQGAVVIATNKYGKGTVLAAGDPWLYNEYTNGRLPPKFENDHAADDITKWLIKQIPKLKL